jgi:hypothetical protein
VEAGDGHDQAAPLGHPEAGPDLGHGRAHDGEGADGGHRPHPPGPPGAGEAPSDLVGDRDGPAGTADEAGLEGAQDRGRPAGDLVEDEVVHADDERHLRRRHRRHPARLQAVGVHEVGAGGGDPHRPAGTYEPDR